VTTPFDDERQPVIRRMARYAVAVAGGHVDLWRDAVREPKGWLLMRAHMSGFWPVPLALVGLGTAFGHTFPAWLLVLVLVAVLPSGAVQLTAGACHGLWQIGVAWRELPCPCCGPRDGGDDGPGDDDGPVEPWDDGGPHGEALTPDDLHVLECISYGLVDVASGQSGGRP
jgi:hypothetical protein